MSTQTGPRDGVATELERVDPARWRADASPWRGQRPVVVAGAFADTVAVATWTPESLAERFPDVAVKAHYMTPQAWGDMSRARSELTTMARFVPLLREGRPCQIMQQSLGRTVGLYDELDIPRVAAPPYYAVNLWIGHGTRTPLHFDVAENLFAQIHGTKRFLLEPPTSPARRYVHEGKSSHISLVDPLAPDPVRFPDYHPGHQLVALLGPGDALYLPPGWFHDVTALDTSISVNAWYGEQIELVR